VSGRDPGAGGCHEPILFFRLVMNPFFDVDAWAERKKSFRAFLVLYYI
jgi:hypothetical protein